MRSDLVWLYFRPHGVVTRQTFVLGWLLPTVIEAGLLWQMMQAEPDSSEIGLWFIVFAVFGGISAFGLLMLSLKRLRGLGWPLLLGILLFVPATSLFTLAALSFPRGAASDQRA